jgi:SAM-dependent methyltransferase
MKDTVSARELDIDAILERVRAELPAQETAAAVSGPRRRAGIHVPSLVDDDTADLVVAGKVWTIAEFEDLDELAFLRLAYRAVLGREVDGSGLAHFLPALRQGRATVAGILGALRYSDEGKAHGTEITGLRKAWLMERSTRVPVLGRIAGKVLRMARRSREIERLHRRVAAADRRSREQVAAINGVLGDIRRSLAYVDSEIARTDALAQEGVTLARQSLDGMDNATMELAVARRIVAEQTARLAGIIDTIKSKAPSDPAALKVLEETGALGLDALYLAFENRFRGSMAVIAERQARYLAMIRQIEPVAAGGTVLDIGCGRGEWLALLTEGNVAARGIDTNAAMVAHSRERGFDVVEGDAIAYLRTLPEGSLATITAFHVVEHLPFASLVALFDEALRVLAPGGAVLFETPNPENLVVGACTFNYDPTHMKPLPPDLLRFLAEARGFGETRIIRTAGDYLLDQEESGFAPQELNDWFRQPPDYAVFARKRPDASAGRD